MEQYFSDQPVVEVKEATVFQGDKAVLEKISFSIQKGEFVYLVGKTGSGKSSLLKTLYCDLPLHIGKASVADYQLHQLQQKDVPFLRRKLGIIFQDFQLLEDRSVVENLSFVLKATGWKDRASMKNRMAEVLMKVGLDNVMTKMPYQLSGGEQQRIVIARALLNDPVLLIADEPTGNLDPEVSEGIFQVFSKINQGGTTVLMATHDYSLIESHPNRTLKCADKQLNELLIKPAN